ncbi:MAG: AtpZ/AtpI family protein [Planctomycetaceae bacterium]
MNPPNDTSDEENLEHAVARQSQRKIRARREGDRGVWFGLGMFGLIGWSITVPTLVGAAVGVWIDARYNGPHSWTLMLLLVGVGTGCVNAWMWVSRESEPLTEEQGEPNE